MSAARRKLSSYLPRPLRPYAAMLGRQALRARITAREYHLRALVAQGRGVEHVHGSPPASAGPTDLIVLCLVRNGAAHLPTFIPYYQRLGARHLVFLDNGSTDETREIVRSFDQTSLFTTDLSYDRYNVALQRWMVKRFGGKGGWSLTADMDELWDYPFSGRLPLDAFLTYLNRRGYDAVTAQNLEMVCDEPLSAIQEREVGNLEETHVFYDLSDIRKTTDPWWLEANTFDTEGHFSHTGGIRESVWGYAGDKLTKQPLVRYSDRLDFFPIDVHFVGNARIADVTTVFRHYKYTGIFFRHVQEEIERKEHYRNAEVFQLYEKVLRENPDLCLVRPTSHRYHGAEDLLESGFLIATPEYLQWVREHARPPGRS